MKLSILIAAYNVEQFIEKCILSCFDANLAHLYEIIVVDDGSTDNTNQIIKKLICKNLKIISKSNEGLGAARNTGIECATGEYIWMIDGDDFLSIGVIADILQKINSQNDCYGINFNLVKEDGTLIKTKYPPNYIDRIYTGSEYYNLYYYDSYTWQFIFKRDIFIINNLRFQERINMQDSEIFPKIMYQTKSVEYFSLIAYNYVQQSNSFTNSNNSSKRIKYFESIIKVKNSLKEFGESIKEKDILLYQGILKKEEAIHEIVFNHLVFYKYDTKTLQNIIIFLRDNKLYPLKFKTKGKFIFVKFGLNLYPILTKKIIDNLI